VKALMGDEHRRSALRQNAIFAAASLDGEREKAVLTALFDGLD
jgi:hypothetical protein